MFLEDGLSSLKDKPSFWKDHIFFITWDDSLIRVLFGMYGDFCKYGCFLETDSFFLKINGLFWIHKACFEKIKHVLSTVKVFF